MAAGCAWSRTSDRRQPKPITNKRRGAGLLPAAAGVPDRNSATVATLIDSSTSVTNSDSLFRKPPGVTMALTRKQSKEFWKALRDAFDASQLKRMLRFALDRRLDEIAGPGNFQQVVFELIEDAERAGYTMELLLAARQFQPGNERLLAFAEQFGCEPPSVGSSFEKFRTIGPGDNAEWALVFRILNSGQHDMKIRRAVYFLDRQKPLPILPDAKHSQVYRTGFEV
jgi:hypothetical protein